MWKEVQPVTSQVVMPVPLPMHMCVLMRYALEVTEPNASVQSATSIVHVCIHIEVDRTFMVLQGHLVPIL